MSWKRNKTTNTKYTVMKTKMQNFTLMDLNLMVKKL